LSRTLLGAPLLGRLTERNRRSGVLLYRFNGSTCLVASHHFEAIGNKDKRDWISLTRIHSQNLMSVDEYKYA
jgi:hypothetical protein